MANVTNNPIAEAACKFFNDTLAQLQPSKISIPLPDLGASGVCMASEQASNSVPNTVATGPKHGR